ncbi:MAG: CDP-glycerol glycerophosphotransferase [Petroclostridium sp.]|jgi:CDP-glycerol glycerophosphotransferase (TagB/SpsB family)|nr:CDP-glycerol glycerophosphotransferase [Petroclostridium sp.]
MNKVTCILLNVLSNFIKKDKKLITILFKGYSGSNISPIIDHLASRDFKDYKVKLLRVDKYKINSRNIEGIINAIKERYIKYKYVFKSQLVISTHGFYRLRRDSVLINLWHGIPLKSMALMNKSKNDKIGVINDDYFLSTSEFYNTIMNACLGIRAEQYHITGYPRNDYLFNENGKRNLECFIKTQFKAKIILYMPTYKDIITGFEEGERDNFFGFEKFDFKKFNSFLKNNNILFILKLHPNEEKIFSEIYSKFINEHIFLLKSEELEKNEMDLYKIINAVDLLITDYSSVYFDYLLIDKPVVFTPTDLDLYRKQRGLLLEPYDFWTPGPKCLDQDTLQSEIIYSLENLNYYKSERETIKNLIHKHQDGNSTKRVIELIMNIMEN